MNVILYLGVFWTIYGILGIFGFQVINEKYRNHDWTRSYIRYRGISWLMLGIPWLVIYLLANGKDISGPVLCSLLLLCGAPSIAYTMISERKYEHMIQEKKSAACGSLTEASSHEMKPALFAGASSQRNSGNDFIHFLKDEIAGKMPLEGIVDTFERMCSMPIKEDMVLFETGTFHFTGKPLFQISLVRQFPNGREEFYQVHVDVLYQPTDENKGFHEATWDENISENIFDYIRKSEAYVYAKDKEYIQVDIYLDET